jgi:hypothetical protein
MKSKAEIAEIARQNGRKSKGPITAAGKSRVAKNGIRTGATVSAKNAAFVPPHCAVLMAEDRKAFFDILAQHIIEFRPAGPTATSFVRAAAVDQWRLNRLDALESAIISPESTRKLHSFIPIFPGIADLLDSFHAGPAVSIRPSVLKLIRRLRREYRASRGQNYTLLANFLKRFPAPAVRPQSIAGERNGTGLDLPV